ncbi:MAG: hypothetical protein HY554_13475 [Elusimicrobia bacterium]|nr:hypothetical protein [Elusimicrobiota bacterium]
MTLARLMGRSLLLAVAVVSVARAAVGEEEAGEPEYIPSESAAAPAPEGSSKCVISMPACPKHPRMYPVPSFMDVDPQGAKQSNQDQGRCLERAQEYFQWCGSLVPVQTDFYRGDQIVSSATAGGRRMRVSVDFSQSPLGPEFDTDEDLGTQNAWAPGAPRLAASGNGAFMLLLRGSFPCPPDDFACRPRTSLRFDLVWRPSGGAGWRPIASDLGPAVSDPILLLDSSERVHVLYPSLRRCGGLRGKGNVVHKVFARDGSRWTSREVPTARLWQGNDAACNGAPRAQRLGGAIQDQGRALAIAFLDMGGKGNELRFASCDLATLKWAPARRALAAEDHHEGFGYTFVTPGPAGQVSLITTSFAKTYFKTSRLQSGDGGATWEARTLCDSSDASREDPANSLHNCDSIDLLQDTRGRVHIAFGLDAAHGAFTPMLKTGALQDRPAAYLLSSDRDGAAFPIVDPGDPEWRSPNYQSALGQLGDYLVVIGPWNIGKLGIWVSEDFGMNWHFEDITSQAGSEAEPYQFLLAKPRHGGPAPRSLKGLYTATTGAGFRTFEFEVRGLALHGAREYSSSGD